MSDLTHNLYRVIEKNNTPRPMEKWHASSISECPRAQYFKRLGVPAIEKPGAGKILRWRAGHSIEGEIRKELLELYPDGEFNQRYETDTLTGEFDFYVPSLKRIIEIKSVHDFAMRQKNKEAILRDDEPYLNHELQNHCYVLLLRKHNKEVEEIEYLYITLGGLMCSYRTPVKKKLLRNVQARLKTLNEAWEKQEPPECICKEDHPLWKSTMQWCQYKDSHGCCNLNLIKEK